MRRGNNDLKLLSEIGFSTTLRGLDVDADSIFEGLASERPDNAAGVIGKALRALVRRDFDAAIRMLQERGINAEVASDEARSVLALALKLAGRENEAVSTANTIKSKRSNAAQFADLVAKASAGSDGAPAVEPAVAGPLA